ncbi:MAG TPA: hypothetical protein VGD68_13605, partial [Streptosporangiaceae bacterium]
MMAVGDSGEEGNRDLRPLPGLQLTSYLGVPPADSACPPEYAGVPARELFTHIKAQQQVHAAAVADEGLMAGFQPRTAPVPPLSGSGFESGGVLDTCPPSGTLAGLADAATRDGRLAQADDDELIGVLR